MQTVLMPPHPTRRWAIDAAAEAVLALAQPLGRKLHSAYEPICAKVRRIRVLLADDHQVMREGLARLLQGHGDIEVIGQAADGQQAVELALQLRPDVVLMDVVMPGIDGIEATRRIRRELPHVQIIGLSMHDEEEVTAAMSDAGAAAYLVKTIAPTTLVSTIRRIVLPPLELIGAC